LGKCAINGSLAYLQEFCNYFANFLDSRLALGLSCVQYSITLNKEIRMNPSNPAQPLKVALPSVLGFGVDALFNAYGQQYQTDANGNSLASTVPVIQDGSPILSVGTTNVIVLADGVTMIPVDLYSFNDYTNVLDLALGTPRDPSFAKCWRIKTTIANLNGMLGSYSEALAAIAADAAGTPSGTGATNLANLLAGGGAAWVIQTPGPDTDVEVAGVFVPAQS
jgi:hypothetical protein